MVKRSRRRGVIAVIVAVVLLSGLAVVGDRVVRGTIQDRIEAKAADALTITGDVTATVGGTFVLPQVIGGRLDDLHLSIAQVSAGAITATDVEVEASGVPISGTGTVDDVSITGVVPNEVILEAVQSQVDLPDGVTIELLDGDIAVVTTVLGVRISATVAAVPQPRSISFSVEQVNLGGLTIDPAAIGFDPDTLLQDATVSLDELPTGIDLTELELTDTGATFTLHGTDVAL